MGLGIAVVNHKGEILERVDDPKNYLHKLLPSSDEEAPSILTKVDWYGDTYFNYLQTKQFLAEWEQLAQRAQEGEERSLVDAVKTLALRCQHERNVLRFIGD
jgi:hypothetical protein